MLVYFCLLLPRFCSVWLLLGNKKRTFVYQDKGAFFELCLPSANDVGFANDDGYA